MESTRLSKAVHGSMRPMKNPLPSDSQVPPQPALGDVVGQSELIRGAVVECAAELSSVNSTLAAALSTDAAEPALDDVLQQNQAVEAKVQVCADDLTEVNHALKVEITERHLLEVELASAYRQSAMTLRASLHDPLTELPNRSLFNDRLQHGLAQAKRHGWTLAVMFIDLDGFKGINDSHGHGAGDEVLKAVASRLKSITREGDTVSRYGGDEFLYLQMELRQESDASRVAEKIIASIGEPLVLETAAMPTRIMMRCSVGISIYPRNGSTDALLVDSADRAMYRAKRAGGGYSLDVDGPPSGEQAVDRIQP